ncbi:MarR family winged helix-turn-helix transcriptional regulator [Paracoccus luteus]|uniref:MarR family winged helix-turn-helix transcriptional regulator n=1 Tax=Paracoccus luteus TaxID=2508543 RepID=UPI00106F9D3E|nr:MarR family winged helix-turn-helix transcriptional regulator [Paracoccus luteus]
MESVAVNNLGLLLHDAARLLRRRFEARSKDLGLPSAQWRLLIRLVREGKAPQVRLAELLEIEPISVSRLVDRMVEGGWVTREKDPLDRRVNLVVPTRKATRAFEELRGTAEIVFDEALAGVSPTDRQVLIAALSTIVSNLSGPPQSQDCAAPACETAP